VFGGTFDPIHVGHLVAAVNVRHDLELDCVLLVVANSPWQKERRRTVTPAEDRFAVVQAAVEGAEGLEASRLEIDRGGTSYTVDTLRELGERHPGAELYLVVGSDLADELSSWDRIEEASSLATLVVVSRAGSRPGTEPPGWQVRHVAIPALDISSTDLRARVAEGRPIDFLVPAPALRCIKERGLYAGS
jgi:nicotinate-nucleotide adenylyltransferase